MNRVHYYILKNSRVLNLNGVTVTVSQFDSEDPKMHSILTETLLAQYLQNINNESVAIENMLV